MVRIQKLIKQERDIKGKANVKNNNQSLIKRNMHWILIVGYQEHLLKIMIYKMKKILFIKVIKN